MVGATIEWYDFFIYATAAALVFPELFFPELSPLAGTLASFSVFAVGMIARPAGAALFGHLGDKAGRKKALVIALLTMGVSSTLIGLMPTFAVIGVLAPILLTLLRLVQGLAVGGQWAGAMLLVTESAPRGKKGFYGGFAQLGVPLGIVTSNTAFLIMSAVLSDEAFLSWGWRVPFLVSIALIGVGIYVQMKLHESPVFERVRETHTEARSPVVDVIRTNPKQIFLAGGAFAAYMVYFYVIVSFAVSYGTTNLGLSRSTMLTGVLLGAVAQMCTIIGSAALSDRIGRRKIYLTGVALLALWAFPCFMLIDTRSVVLVWLAMGVTQLFMGVSYGPQAALFAEMFGTRVRYSGASLGAQLGAILGGAFAPIIATSLFAATGTSLSVSAYLLAISVVSFASVGLIAETFKTDLAKDRPEERRLLRKEHT